MSSPRGCVPTSARRCSGCSGPSVTIVARSMQIAGLIRYSRGVFAIANRKELRWVRDASLPR